MCEHESRENMFIGDDQRRKAMTPTLTPPPETVARQPPMNGATAAMRPASSV